MNPQHAAYSFLTVVPLSLVLGASALFGYLFLAPKENRPRMGLALWLFVLWALWVTLTTIWAQVPQYAWEKWDWAFKTICFAAFLPFLFKTRVHLEAMLLTLVLSLSATTLAGAVKTLVTGGGYHLNLGLVRGNSGLAEGSTLACLAVASVPIFLYMHNYSQFFKNRRFSFCLFYGLSAASVLVSVGTFERTALIALAVLAIVLFPSLSLKHKYLYAIALGIVVLTSGYFLSDRWMSRMQTIQNYQTDDSAMVRIKVWLWTLDYVGSHPLGGGFDVYRINRITLPGPNTGLTSMGSVDTREQEGRAFHSSWFEVLGEQGMPGMAIFIAMIVTFYSRAFVIRRRTKGDDNLKWANSLSRYMMMSVTIYLAAGSFIGVAFQPFLYDLIAAGIVLGECVRRALIPSRVAALADNRSAQPLYLAS
jgi:probable O-glycosylation ligase (exosortase A-associated)